MPFLSHYSSKVVRRVSTYVNQVTTNPLVLPLQSKLIRFNNDYKFDFIKGIIADGAGTTFDFGCMAPVISFSKLLCKKYQIPYTEEQIRRHMGLAKIDHLDALLNMREKNVSERINKVFGNLSNNASRIELVSSLFEELQSIFIEVLKDPEHTRLIPGVLNFYHYIRSHSIKMGMTTGYNLKMTEIIEPALRKQGLHLDAPIVSPTASIRPRPFPDMPLAVAKALKLSPHECIVFDDTPVGLEAGTAAGMSTIGVAFSSNSAGHTYQSFIEDISQDKQSRMKNVIQELRVAKPNYVVPFMGLTEEYTLCIDRMKSIDRLLCEKIFRTSHLPIISNKIK